ncbi:MULTISPECIES: MFS transporter [Sutcliffiella]|uniref:Major facilitator superfamily (MFS) profile domain-containing protein n=1 Tax=Sutcliffiella cohnii TaxID=33932 RepID=A0A223KVR5_9BACI|nr:MULTISPECIES: MFS transporter [Sutcliffiella]AST93562.1 hypothetical protein BC6307_20975 [Sutcliffiella cohnii]WBL14750.1 MFS transporter [Sutcliffiella sp. NC1]
MSNIATTPIKTQQVSSNVLKNKNFLLLWLGSTLNYLTFNIFTLSLPLMIYDLTQSTLAMSSMRAIEFLPNILLAVFIGVLSDRYSRKKVMLSAVVIKTLSIGTILTLILFTDISIWMLYIIGFVLYTSTYTFGNAYHSIMPLVVKKDQLTEVNSYLSFTRELISIIGPAIAGLILLVTTYQYGITITLVGLLVLLIAVSLLNVPNEDKVPKKREGLFKEISAGWDCLIENKMLWSLTLIVCISNVASAMTIAVFIFYALKYFGISEFYLGIVLSSAAVGGLLAASIAKKLRKWFYRGHMITFSLILSAIGYFILFASVYWVFLAVGIFLIGFSGTIIGIHYSTLRQESTPNHLLGRVAGTSSTIMKLATPLAFLIAGLLGELITVNYLFLISVFIIFVTLFYLYYSKAYKLE